MIVDMDAYDGAGRSKALIQGGKSDSSPLCQFQISGIIGKKPVLYGHTLKAVHGFRIGGRIRLNRKHPKELC